MQCPHLDTCVFFGRFSDRTSRFWDILLSRYCRGPQVNQCERLQFQRSTGHLPPDNLCPTGPLHSDLTLLP